MLRTRVFTALVGISVLLFFIYLGGYWYGLIVLIIAMIGLKEYYSLMRKKGWHTVELSGYLFLPIALLSVYRENALFVLALWTVFFAAVSLFPVFFHTRVNYWESTLSYWGIIYTGGLASFLLAIRLLPGGFILTLFLFLMVWSEDIMAYFIGSLAGKTPLAPQISPKKTLEGTIAGITASSLTGLLLSWLFAPDYLNLLTGMLLGLIVGTAAALGDLSQSALKRSVGVKDSGGLLPGHGGILDRFDSLFFAAPFFYIYIIFIQYSLL
ncbi:MAG: phosphatidate cytidylyltransferase [Dethiobacter sp.]|jgi:phosphatidate cytidylyltransferase|nr:MAG: phosphatidate cytidylyltransferase [Dethiobacter sp.]